MFCTLEKVSHNTTNKRVLIIKTTNDILLLQFVALGENFVEIKN